MRMNTLSGRLLCAIVAAAATLCLCHGADPQTPQFKASSPLDWSVRMADSQVARSGDSVVWREGGRAKWDYTVGLFSLSLIRLNEIVPNPAYISFSTNAIGSFIPADGKIRGYKAEDFNIDNVAPGRAVLALYKVTGEPRYKKAADLLHDQLREHPRTSEGGFWHKQRYPWQMWLDGLFMGAPFYAEYTQIFPGADDAKAYDDVVKQFQLIDKHLYDQATGLYYHGWDEKKQQDWANKSSGTSSNFWGRGLGWFAMAQVDVLDYLPQSHPGRRDILRILEKAAQGIRKYQDPQSGLWWQVLDQGGRKGNYLEATASSMFVYSLAKALNKGYLHTEYKAVITRGYKGIVEKLVREDGDGKISLTQCCSVAGLGYGRDGSYEYYLKEPVVDNDLKGVGPFILAGIEVQKLLGAPMNANASRPLAALAAAGGAEGVSQQWKGAENILANIREPQIPGREFSITSYGAAADGKSDSSKAIAAAIDAASKAGGGRVVVPAGEFITGPIHLKSRVNLHLDGGATLKFSTDPAAYLPAVRTRFEGMDCWNYSPLIYAYGQHDIAITGDGVLDGQASDENWWAWKGQKGKSNTQMAARARLANFVADNVPPEERRFGEGDYLRPSFIEPYRCSNVLIEGVKIRRSPMWEVHPLFSTNVTVRGLNIQSHGPNNDGCDPECCKNVLIEKTVFDTGDDCIAIKSGRNNDGRREATPTENVIIRDCTMKEGHGGVTIGSEISGGCRNVFVYNCVMDSSNLDRAIRFKSNALRGGLVENIFVRNVKVGTVADAALQIDFLYEEGTNGVHNPVVRNVIIENMNVANANRVLDVRGFKGAEISNVRIVNSTFNNLKQKDRVLDADVKLVNCVVESK